MESSNARIMILRFGDHGIEEIRASKTSTENIALIRVFLHKCVYVFIFISRCNKGINVILLYGTF